MLFCEKNMKFSKSFSVLFFAAFAYHSANAYCIPCPKEGLGLSDFTDCDCPMNKYSLNKKCIDYSECPNYTLGAFSSFQQSNFGQQIKEAYNKLTNLMNTNMMQNKNKLGDFEASTKMFNRFTEDVKTNLNKLLAPLVGTLAASDRDLSEECNGDTACILSKAPFRKQTYDNLMPTMKPMFTMFEDGFKNMAKTMGGNCPDGEDCPMARTFAMFTNFFPQAPNTAVSPKRNRH